MKCQWDHNPTTAQDALNTRETMNFQNTPGGKGIDQTPQGSRGLNLNAPFGASKHIIEGERLQSSTLWR